MRSLDVALTPRQPLEAEVIVVIDCIRATTTIDRAISGGYERVYCVGSIARARALAKALEGAVLGGERHGLPPKGFDLGNSPKDYETPRGRVVVLTTTNGTRAILQATREAKHVLIGSSPALGAVSEAALRLARGRPIAVRCAGVQGQVALDDVVLAGRFVARLLELDPGRVLTDGARIALAASAAYPDLVDALHASRSGRALDGTGHEADIPDCARSGLPVRVAAVAGGDAHTAIIAPLD
jgi:2-phosphosulfolactate phosphatase